MLPIILETTSEVDRNNFIEEFILEQKIKPYNCFIYEPEAKELSIRQVREIINETNFHSTEPRLFHILNFDTASAEAQNAFLKTLEEHQPQLNFILSVVQASNLLPTILSRSRLIKLRAHKTADLSAKLEVLLKLLESGKLPSLFQIANQIGKNDSLVFFDSLIALYRGRLGSDKKAAHILRMVVEQRNLTKHNHIDPQTTIDSALISIYNSYR
ncbi:MAG: hypothetical protein WAT72_00520 [Microgenomates group bacterium]|jgi:DNA polymerase III gamma/tau subunit|nr:hypothetical protein [Candidatus Woesebacteria bacterium]MBP6883260.1 hypothetical protein [Candidatus Woesebacteria bacterium]QQR64277.1 MAG: hypothetical protein IPH70_02020 [Candidatus Roizmanbacteria bacterium]